MDSARFVGSVSTRLATIAFALVCLGGVVQYGRAPSSIILTVTVGSGFLAFIGLIHCFRTLYSRWMRFAGLLHTVALTVLFGACYLFVVPLFYLFVRVLDPLKLRSRGQSGTFWIRRRNPGVDPSTLQRMG